MPSAASPCLRQREPRVVYVEHPAPGDEPKHQGGLAVAYRSFSVPGVDVERAPGVKEALGARRRVLERNHSALQMLERHVAKGLAIGKKSDDYFKPLIDHVGDRPMAEIRTAD